MSASAACAPGNCNTSNVLLNACKVGADAVKTSHLHAHIARTLLGTWALLGTWTLPGAGPLLGAGPLHGAGGRLRRCGWSTRSSARPELHSVFFPNRLLSFAILQQVAFFFLKFFFAILGFQKSFASILIFFSKTFNHLLASFFQIVEPKVNNNNKCCRLGSC